MKAAKFNECNLTFAKDQPEYNQLPAHHTRNDSGQIVFCWQLTFRERLKLLFTGKLWHSVLTFYQPLQPQRIELAKPQMTQK